MTLENDFHNEMVAIYHRAVSQSHYRPTRFLQMVQKGGGLVTAKKLLVDGKGPSEGLIQLVLLGHPELSMEALVSDPRWSSLFTEQELKAAKRRLR